MRKVGGKRANKERTFGKKDGREEKRREKDQVLQLVRCCVWFLLSFFFFFKYRKTAFGLNLEEAENGMAVALGRELL